MGSTILNDDLQLPRNVLVSSMECPFYFISDEAFALKEDILKPYARTRGKPMTDGERIFNTISLPGPKDVLLRSRPCSENHQGLLPFT